MYLLKLYDDLASKAYKSIIEPNHKNYITVMYMTFVSLFRTVS